jgi:hypothetical protein
MQKRTLGLRLTYLAGIIHVFFDASAKSPVSERRKTPEDSAASRVRMNDHPSLLTTRTHLESEEFSPSFGIGAS